MAEVLSPFAVAQMNDLSLEAKLLYTAIFTANRHPGEKSIPQTIEAMGKKLKLLPDKVQSAKDELINRGLLEKEKPEDIEYADNF